MKYRTYRFSRSLTVLIALFIVANAAWAEHWRIADKLTEAPLQYGEALAISQNGKTAAVSKALEDCPDGKKRCGAVYVYVRKQGQWQQQAKLFAADAVENTQLGGYDFYDRTIALNDDGTVLAAATNPNALGSGAVYVFARTGKTWQERQKLTLPTALLPTAQICGQDNFGRSLALSGDGASLSVGATNECLPDSAGAAYLFINDGSQWLAQTRLVGSQAEARDVLSSYGRGSYFGSAVDLAGDGKTLLVGSRGFPSDLAQAYVFVKNANGDWVEQAVLSPSDHSLFPVGNFGQFVALAGNGGTALIADNEGTVYVFSNDANGSWHQETKLGANIVQRSNQFGFSLALDDSGDQAVIGDWGAGTAFFYTRIPQGKQHGWRPQLLLSSADSGGGLGSSIVISGDASAILVSDPFVTPPPSCTRPDGSVTGCGTVYWLKRR